MKSIPDQQNSTDSYDELGLLCIVSSDISHPDAISEYHPIGLQNSIRSSDDSSPSIASVSAVMSFSLIILH